MSHDRVGPRAVLRSVAFLAAGVLAVPVLVGCGDDDPAGKPLAGQDIAPAERNRIADGGTLRWAVDSVPQTLNVFQADADPSTARVAGAVLPSMFRFDASGRPERHENYLESAEIVEREPRQVVLYKLHQKAVWSDGRRIGAADFAAQWRALSGRDSSYWTARNAGYDRIEKVERGAGEREVRVTFNKPYTDWKSLFSPLYPKDVTGTPRAFNDGARRNLKVTAGPFALQRVDRTDREVTLTRNPRWWGRSAKLKQLVLRAVPREERVKALADGRVDIAEIAPRDARRISLAGRRVKGRKGASAAHAPAGGLRGFVVRKSLEPVYTQLALNGVGGPLADERVRRAVVRALDREELAGLVLKPLGLPHVPVGSHLALAGQAAYADNSGALGGEDTKEAKALLAEAGWAPGGPVKEPKKAAGAEGRKGNPSDEPDDDGGQDPDQEETRGLDDNATQEPDEGGTDGTEDDGTEDDGTSIVGEDNKPRDKQGGAQGAYAPRGTAATAGAASGPLAKNGKPLSLRFVLPSGPGSDSLRIVGRRIARMLERVGIRTRITRVPDDSYFKDHVANGQYDLALYSWPSTAFPATDARPIYAKPVPAADGSLSVEQNYTRVGTDQIDQLFEQAIATLDEGESRSLIRKADARIWAAAGSVPLYQRPQLVATRKHLANAGAFGFQTPVYEDMGFLKKPGRPAPNRS